MEIRSRRHRLDARRRDTHRRGTIRQARPLLNCVLLRLLFLALALSPVLLFDPSRLTIELHLLLRFPRDETTKFILHGLSDPQNRAVVRGTKRQDPSRHLRRRYLRWCRANCYDVSRHLTRRNLQRPRPFAHLRAIKRQEKRRLLSTARLTRLEAGSTN